MKRFMGEAMVTIMALAIARAKRTDATGETLKAFLLAGQPNIEGQGKAGDSMGKSMRGLRRTIS